MKPGRPIDGATRLYGILGHPVASSLSPAMHNAAFAALSLNAAYLPFPVAPEDLPQAVAGLVAAGIGGFNLTVPHKQAILPLLQEITPAARTIGAVNTVRCEGGKLIGTNTDGEGFLLSLEREIGWKPAGQTVTLLGAGGAARGIAFSLLESGVEALTILNRTPERAQELAADCRAHFGGNSPGGQVTAGALEPGAPMASDLLINATTLGMGDGANPVDLQEVGFQGAGFQGAVADIVYAPLETPLLAQARQMGLRQVNGLGMLLHQGALAFTFWTGREAPLEVMRQALMEGLDARGK